MIVFNYIIYYFIILPLSVLPFRALYFISDFLYLLFYYVIGYRKKVVHQNLVNSFPKKSKQEIKEIEKKFYHHLCDLVVESVKQFSITNEEVNKRMVPLNAELFDKYKSENKSIVLAGGHFNNWELFAVAIDQCMAHQAIGIYKPLSNKFFDHKMRASRSKFGLLMISTKRIAEVYQEMKDRLIAVIYAVDQSPSNPKKAYWMRWLNQDTPMLFGAEKNAVKYDHPVLYGRINKVKRGYYTFEFVEIFDRPKETKHGEITEKINHLLEQDIVKHPQYWLWTHRRWKHARPQDT
jgi:KDO2-lipid IV(A) lauroyltransferase